MIIEANAGAVDVSGDEVVFLDHDGGVAFTSPTDKTKSIRKVKLDGTGASVLYTAVAKHQINDVKTVGTTIYFLESERDEFGNEATSLFSMPVAGGTPTLIGKHVDPTVGLDFDRLDAIVAADADSVSVVRGGPSPGSGSLWRFAVAGGAETLVYRGNINSKPQRVGDEYFFLSNDVPSGITNYQSLVKVSAAGGAIAAVGAAKCKDEVLAGSYGILCVGTSETMTSKKLSKWDLNGGGHTIVFELPEKSSHIVRIGPVDGTSVYVEPNVREGTNANISKAPLAGGPATIIACDRQEITRRKTTAGSGSNSAYVSELDMAMTPTELVWVETRKAEGQPRTVAIFRTAR